MANTHSPTLRLSLEAISMGARFSASILMTARSVSLSVPMMRPLNSRLSLSFTRISSASPTTWLLVTIYPSAERMTPDPEPWRFGVSIWRRCCPRFPKKSPKKSENGLSEKGLKYSTSCVLLLVVTLMNTTLLVACSAA